MQPCSLLHTTAPPEHEEERRGRPEEEEEEEDGNDCSLVSVRNLLLFLPPPSPKKINQHQFTTSLQGQAGQIAITSHARDLIKATGDLYQSSVVMTNLDT